MLLKRAFDIFISLLGILFSFPLWLFIAVLIYLEDRGQIFIIQNRLGRGGKFFRVYKFRSMKAGTENVSVSLQACEDDPRVTRVGRILRATAMDELPQLWNILKGDMSFVGPRALLPQEVQVHGKEADSLMESELLQKRCQVRPGLTGVAQIFAPRDIQRKKKFRYDLLYIKKRRFLLDLQLILLSFWITLRGKWESRENKIGFAKEKRFYV